VTLTNNQNVPLSLSGGGLGISVTGTNASSFVLANTCGTSVASGGSCTITVTFEPAKKGALTATVNTADNASGSPQKIALTVTGK
jgi:hypothetical protein